MARDTRPVCRICRAEGKKLFLKGDRCYKTTCSFEKRGYPPGMHGKTKPMHKKISEYAAQLREKQKIKKSYGMLERQFERYYEIATKSPGVTGHKILQLLESRLDNIVYRMGFAVSRRQARQMVRHGHVAVNGKRVDVPSYQVSPGAAIAIPEKSTWHGKAKEAHMAASTRAMIPSYVKVEADRVSGIYLKYPDRNEMPADLNEKMVVEFFSR